MNGWIVLLTVLGCVYAVGVLLILGRGISTDLSRVELALVALLWPPLGVVFLVLWGIEANRWRKVR